jgi:hypothetical protein
MTFYTQTLSSGTFVLSTAQGASMISIQPQASSSCTFIGSGTFNGLQSSAITISNNNTLTISASSPTSPLNGITITWLSGTVDIIVGF